VTAIIEARRIWNRTGIQLESGKTYTFHARGAWIDWYIRHGPEGDPSANFYMRLFERFRRRKNEKWFALIGAVDQNIATAFLIGAGATIQMKYSGELTCFANDVRGFYWNNCGSVVVQVR
jgi:hypothetical protein